MKIRIEIECCEEDQAQNSNRKSTQKIAGMNRNPDKPVSGALNRIKQQLEANK